MHILGLVAENYKRLRVVEIHPKGRMVKITGKNGQGKTSVLDAIYAGLVGARAFAEKPVRKGADKARIKIDLGELIVTRTITPTGTQTLHVENAKGTKIASPQTMLDELLGKMTFDPLQFIQMKPKEQVEMLRTVADIGLDVDALNAANTADYDERRIVNRDVERLQVEVNAVIVQDGLPKAKVDESAILEKINHANAANAKAGATLRKKQELGAELGKAQAAESQHLQFIHEQEEKIKQLKAELAKAEKNLLAAVSTKRSMEQATADARAAYESAPEGEVVDVALFTAELAQAQLANREIDKRTRRETLEKELREKQNRAAELTRSMEARNEQKNAAMANAKMPVAGLTFDENQVLFNGIPISQLGEAEQIRISASIAMAASPKVRIMRILHGEAMDDDSLAVLEQMAEERDFQVWMAKVDSSGKVGIVLEDGMVKSETEE